MKNPLNKRLLRELKSEIGKYIVLFLFLAGMISIVSGFLVANRSMIITYDESFDKYNIEDGNFELYAQANDALLERLNGEKLTVYPNFYLERETAQVDSTLRIFVNREQVDKVCLMEGALPERTDEIAIDRMYADNNSLSVGDMLTVGEKSLRITGLVALSDYSALYASPSDMMFDSIKFGVAIMTQEGFDSMGDVHFHYSYAWIYDDPPADDSQAKEMSEAFLKTLAADAAAEQNAVTGFIPAYSNQAIIFAGSDLKGDNTMITVFLYVVILIIAFVFAITASNTISKEANVIGTLRASGYTRGELVRHYMTMPMLVMLVAAIVGNVLGYTLLKQYMADMYYGSYSLPTYVTHWNGDAFVKTTVVPLILMFCINLLVLVNKMSLSPLKFLRRDLKRRQKKKAFKLNTKIGILKRFRLRVIFQNMPNYVTITIGVLFANFLLLFGVMFGPLLDHYQEEITNNLICQYQYVLKAPQETDTPGAEKYSVESLKTVDDKRKSEDVTVYGVVPDSAYLDLNFDGGVVISNAYAEKFGLSAGDTLRVKEAYGDKEYSFPIKGVYYYPAGIAVFMEQSAFHSTFDQPADAFNGYFSNQKITDLEDLYVATTITVDDMTKTSRQLKQSMGNMMVLFLVFGVAMFMLIVYLLSKIILEKNAQPISMTKILGYSNREINSLYITTTSFVVIGSMLLTIPLCAYLMKTVCVYIFSDYSGWFAYYVPLTVYVKMFLLGVCSYLAVAYLQTRSIKGVPLGEALKNVE